jgi:hypothetical protein
LKSVGRFKVWVSSYTGILMHVMYVPPAIKKAIASSIVSNPVNTAFEYLWMLSSHLL